MQGRAGTPSGKGAGDENFPVGSILLSARLRPHVACFYAFARAADDIADDAALSSGQKLARLDAFEAALRHGSDDPALRLSHDLRRGLLETGVTDRHARDLLQAFRQDAVTARYQTWDDLMAYCRLSATPVGRYLLDLHGEDPALYAQSDPLCDALQVINHLQDCGQDYRRMNRVYLPLDWLAEAGTGVEALTAQQCSPELRRVLDRCLTGCDALMGRAEPLPGGLRSRRLGAESAVIHRLALALIGQLKAHDPLARRVALSKPRMGLVAMGAVLRYGLGNRERAGA